MIFSKIDFSVAKIKLVWWRVTHHCLFSSQPKYLQYFTKSESYNEYLIALLSTPRVRVAGPEPDTLCKVTPAVKCWKPPTVLPPPWIGALPAFAALASVPYQS